MIVFYQCCYQILHTQGHKASGQELKINLNKSVILDEEVEIVSSAILSAR